MKAAASQNHLPEPTMERSAQSTRPETNSAPPIDTPASLAGPFPLSFAQQRLWFLEQLEPNTARYNIPVAAHLTGAVRVDLLGAALSDVIARHEALRTHFGLEDGSPVQWISAPGPAGLTCVDLPDPGASEVDERWRAWLNREARKPFDLTAGPLIRCTLFRLGPNENILLINVHHSICDEWSVGVLFRELTLVYNAFAKGQGSRLPELPIQYADFAMWQRDTLQGPSLAKLLEFWRNRLSGAPPRLDFPHDRPQPPGRSRQGRRRYLDLPSVLSRSLADLSRREGVTLFTLLLASFKALLARYTGQDDILVGSPVSGRTRIETEGLIGFFVNTLVLRTSVTSELTFNELLHRVRQTTLDAYAHQDLPFDKLVEELHPDRRGQEIPLIQAVFALEQSLESDLSLSGVEARLIEVDTETAKFDLTWVVRESGNALQLCVEYAVDLFDEGAIDRMIGHWETLLEGIVADPGRRVSSIPLLRPAERHRAIVEWNQTSRAYPDNASVPELFEAQVQRQPDALAVKFASSEMTYEELNRRADSVASAIRALGAAPGSMIGICIERSPDLIVGLIGILKAGCAYVPLDPSYPKDRLAWMLEDTAAPILLSREGLLKSFPSARAKFLCMEALPAARAAEHCTSPRPDDVAYVIYTSGSTGRPKGVEITHRAIIRLVCGSDYVQLTPEDRVAQASNVSFDAATFEIWGALLNRAALIGVDREALLSPKDFATQLTRDQITTLFLTTALFNQLAAEVPGAFHGLKHLLFGGEMVDPKWVRSILQHRPPARLLHVYGPTETTTFASWHLVSEPPLENATVPIGKPIANTRVYILDSNLEPVPVGIAGEIFIGGPGLARGYLNRPELTAEKFVPDPFSTEPGARLFKTGDLGRYRPDGAIEILGRRDGQLKVRGFRVEPGEIEAALKAHPDVRQSIVVADDAGVAGKRLVAYVVLREDGDATVIGAIRQFLKTKLPHHMLPAALIPLRALPLNANGKVDRSALPALEPSRPELDPSYVAPRTPLEEKLASIWARVLGLDRVGVHDDFFDLGGHSLLAVRLFAAIEAELGRKLPLASLFQRSTIDQLAALLNENDAQTSWPLLVEIRPTGSRPALFWMHSLGGDGGGAFFYYRKLAQLLGPDQPSYGIRSPQEPFTDVHEMAARYLEEVLQFQPRGPYFLGGFCFGGIVAFEMASQLRRRGAQVGLLVLLESAPPLHPRSRLPWRPEMAGALARNAGSWLADLLRQGPNELRSRLWRKARSLQGRLQQHFANSEATSGHSELDALIDMEDYPKDYVRFARAHWEALLKYRARAYPGRITLFRARKQPLLSVDPTLGWGALAEEGVAVNVIPGTHEKMLEEPNVQILAAELKACLVEAQSELEGFSVAERAPENEPPDRVGATPCPCSIIT